MTTARTEILAGLRRALHVTGDEAPRRTAVAARLAGAPRGIVPARAQVSRGEKLALFAKLAEAVQATIATVSHAEDVPAEAARYLRESNLPATLRRGDDPRLAAMPWDSTILTMATGVSAGDDLNAISHAFGGIAETGTLVMVSGPENPSTLNLLPDNHIVVVDADDVDADMESVLARIRERYGKGAMPRTVNFITGPSRSADIAQTMLLGAHGPRGLHIVLVDRARNDADEPSFSRRPPASDPKPA